MMNTDPTALRARAARLRGQANELQSAVQGFNDRRTIDSYTALIAEYDALACQLEHIAGDLDDDWPQRG